MKSICEFRGKYEFLSNYFTCIVYYEDMTYLNVEAAYQASKFANEEQRKAFSVLDPSRAKILGNSAQVPKEWESMKVDVMYQCLVSKFSFNRVLRQQLLDTGDCEIIYGNCYGDTFWGRENGVGENMLGKLLMRVRDEMRRGIIK